MKKKTIIILSCIISVIIIFTVAALIWAFPLQDKWKNELKNGFNSPSEAERYVCNMTETAKKRGGGDTTVNTYSSIVNKKSDTVWQYVGNPRSGGYQEGDMTYLYNGDPLSDGKLIKVGKDITMPLPVYTGYFYFLFNQDNSLDFSSAVSNIWKFTSENVCSYSFTLSHKWVIENNIKNFNMYDKYYYHYSDVHFTIKNNKKDGRVLQISCSYSYNVDSHWEDYFYPPAYGNPGYINSGYVKSYGYKINISVQFAYPKHDTPIETDDQFSFSHSLNNGLVDKTLTIPTDEYVLLEPSTNQNVQYATLSDQNSSTRPTVCAFEKDDILAVYSKNYLEVYQLSTLKKLAAAEYYLDVVCVDVDNGQLLVALSNATYVSCPWEQNYCFVIYNLSDFSVVNRHKAVGYNPDYTAEVYSYLYNNKILYIDDFRICIYDTTSNTTNITEQFTYTYDIYISIKKTVNCYIMTNITSSNLTI